MASPQCDDGSSAFEAPAAPSIKAINRGDVHRICSGQVVLTLATAVKELVENSIDAGATSVEVKLKDHGVDSIEVVDNGSGVESANFQALTLKHHTSKIRDFGDLIGVETFGFRGEALSSLCALCRLSINTRHQSSAVGTRLTFDHSGKITDQSPVHRQPGTTVVLEQLFSTLPVRHSEFKRNLKKEFSRMLHVLSAYCLISVGVRISCTHVTSKGKKNVVLATQSSSSFRDNITSVFGFKQMQSLVEFEQVQAEDATYEEFGLSPEDSAASVPFKITGFVSRPEHGVGRGSCDRQFYFINRRPCDPQKISRVVNEAYHMFNRHQFPFVLLNISLVNDAVDVNVTPDKRQVFIQHEKLLLATLKASLVKLFEQKSTSYSLNQPESSFLSSSAPEASEVRASGASSLQRFSADKSKRSFASAFARGSPQATSPNKRTKGTERKLDNFFRSSAKYMSASNSVKEIVPNSPASKMISASKEHSPEIHSSPKVIEKETLIAQEGELPVQSESWTALKTKDSIANNFQVPADPETLNITFTETDQKLKLKDPRREISVPFDMNALKTTLQSHSAAEKASQLNPCSTFRAKIDPTDNQSAEEELRREIKKESFCAMEVLGQFNLGFVIARLNQDLFIIDQHASDEKYNFEMLQKHTVLSSQRLVCPQILPLTAANEVILMDNLDIFKRNGFAFEVDEEGPPTQRVKLVSKPISKNWEFGRDDIEELVFMLSDSSGIMCRPTRVRQMLASRACRKSIMIGTALNQPEMNKLLRHMSEIEHPWNCPHGRPTMRHLINLDRIKVCE